jgi:hypothetical protein
VRATASSLDLQGTGCKLVRARLETAAKHQCDESKKKKEERALPRQPWTLCSFQWLELTTSVLSTTLGRVWASSLPNPTPSTPPGRSRLWNGRHPCRGMQGPCLLLYFCWHDLGPLLGPELTGRLFPMPSGFHGDPCLPLQLATLSMVRFMLCKR